jgi:hypothetical protein
MPVRVKRRELFGFYRSPVVDAMKFPPCHHVSACEAGFHPSVCV